MNESVRCQYIQCREEVEHYQIRMAIVHSHDIYELMLDAVGQEINMVGMQLMKWSQPSQ